MTESTTERIWQNDRIHCIVLSFVLVEKETEKSKKKISTNCTEFTKDQKIIYYLQFTNYKLYFTDTSNL